MHCGLNVLLWNWRGGVRRVHSGTNLLQRAVSSVQWDDVPEWLLRSQPGMLARDLGARLRNERGCVRRVRMAGRMHKHRTRPDLPTPPAQYLERGVRIAAPRPNPAQNGRAVDALPNAGRRPSPPRC